MADLASIAETKVSSTTVDMKTVASTTLYTVPTGKVFRPTKVCIRDTSASLARGAGATSYAFTGWLSGIDLTGMTTPNTSFRWLLSVTNTSYTENAAGADFQITVTTGSDAAATAIIDVFGYLT